MAVPFLKVPKIMRIMANRVNTIYINLTELIKKGYNQERLILWVIEPQCVIPYPRSLQLHNDHKF